MNKKFEKYWGIDISKEWLDIAIDNQIFSIAQKEEAIVSFIKKHQAEAKDALAILESTGGYERLAVQCLASAGFTVHVSHPNKVVAFAKAKGRLMQKY